MVVLNHAGEELLCEVVVAEGVDFEGEIDVFLGGIQYCFPARNASVLTAILPGSGNTLLRSSRALVGSVSVLLAKNYLSQIRLKK